jgi:hypothetical protein
MRWQRTMMKFVVQSAIQPNLPATSRALGSARQWLEGCCSAELDVLHKILEHRRSYYASPSVCHEYVLEASESWRARANVCSAARLPINLFREFSMTFPDTSETTANEEESQSGGESEPQFQHHTDRYEPPDVVRLGEVAEVGHNYGPHHESVGSYYQN